VFVVSRLPRRVRTAAAAREGLARVPARGRAEE